MKEQENLTGKGITAAVLDTGIFPHMDFDGRIVAFRDLVYGRETPYDDNGHGTHVCGILGGSGRASGGKYQGAAPGCRFVVVKILDRRGNGRKQDILAAGRQDAAEGAVLRGELCGQSFESVGAAGGEEIGRASCRERVSSPV